VSLYRRNCFLLLLSSTTHAYMSCKERKKKKRKKTSVVGCCSLQACEKVSRVLFVCLSFIFLCALLWNLLVPGGHFGERFYCEEGSRWSFNV
jgi:hypothetical protein